MSNQFIPLSVPNFCGNERKYVDKAISTEWVSTSGSFISRFEKDMASYLHVNDAVACQSGTAGIHLALIALDIGTGDEVIAPVLTFIAAVNPIRYTGAEPIFMDCDDSLCIDPYKLELFLKNECFFKDNKTYNKKTNSHIKAIIVVHVFGNIADMEHIASICEKYNIMIIEDATEALGSYYTESRYAGKFAGTIGHIGIYSFNGNKIITTGGGGMVVSNDEAILQKIRHLSKQAKADELNFTHDDIGYNYRMTNLQAALGVAQLEQLEQFIEIKKTNYQTYKDGLADIRYFELIDFKKGTRPNYWFYSLVLKDKFSLTTSEIINYLSENNIQARPIWGLIHQQKPYLSNQSYVIEKAYFYHEHIINIPCSSNLSKENVLTVVDSIKKLL